MTATQYLKDLNQRYLDVHRTKEDLFWDIYMGISNEHDRFATAQTAWTHFLSNADQISDIEQQLSTLNEIADLEERKQTQIGLEGWLATFRSHAIEVDKAQALKTELIAFETELFEKKQNHALVYVNEEGEQVDASLPALRSTIMANENEAVRQSAHQTLLDLEQWLLGNGFIDLVKLRNQFARSLGYDNFFDYSVLKNEKMTTTELFAILDDFEQRTRQVNLTSLDKLASEKGQNALTGYNFNYSFSGDSMRELDPYVPFSKSLRRWVESFGRLNIDYSGAELTLDLLDRQGKYQNGFCHGPIPSFYDDGRWIAAKVNFTSNAKPDQIGSGYDASTPFSMKGTCRPLCQRQDELTLFFSGVCTDVHGLCRNSIHVLRQPAE